MLNKLKKKNKTITNLKHNLHKDEMVNETIKSKNETLKDKAYRIKKNTKASKGNVKICINKISTMFK